MTDFDADGLVTLDTHYDYDPRGTLLGWRLLDANGQQFKRFEVRSPHPGCTETLQYDETDAMEFRFVEETGRDGRTVYRTFDSAGRERPSPGAV